MPLNEGAGQVLLAPIGPSGGSCADTSMVGASRNGHHQQHPSDPVELRRINFQTPALLSHQPIAVSDLAAHIAYLKDNEGRPFSDVSRAIHCQRRCLYIVMLNLITCLQEYESIDAGQQATWENSHNEINKAKNRYANVIAYDHSRVVLENLEGDEGRDYINANFMDGYRKQHAYVATQGPLPDTVGDFWRMVWEQNTATIVMMTRLEERARVRLLQNLQIIRTISMQSFIHIS